MEQVPVTANAFHGPLAVTPPVAPKGAEPASLPPESLWRLLQQAAHLAPRTCRPRVRELDE